MLKVKVQIFTKINFSIRNWLHNSMKQAPFPLLKHIHDANQNSRAPMSLCIRIVSTAENANKTVRITHDGKDGLSIFE
ncbi:hypothetical protein SAMN05216326_12426 [Nitrosomonas marina]|uniref:Uncharacterized protein n=1 Tax=Nitrosomonas marina TaxID=917 RepID=A0A1I0E216_9PROT|nr:hypothetical protein [Nitrosomonas marina]SET38893.1 hypothetical protein SAMN05216326_12426 [Nitrosomonas marina]